MLIMGLLTAAYDFTNLLQCMQQKSHKNDIRDISVLLCLEIVDPFCSL